MTRINLCPAPETINILDDMVPSQSYVYSLHSSSPIHQTWTSWDYPLCLPPHPIRPGQSGGLYVQLTYLALNTLCIINNPGVCGAEWEMERKMEKGKGKSIVGKNDCGNDCECSLSLVMLLPLSGSDGKKF